jgi:tetratricopeptide (TPR) repeat protein
VLLYLNRAAVHTTLGNLALAEEDLTKADELTRLFNLRGFVGRIIEARANIAREQRQFEKADQLYSAAIEEYRSADVDPTKSDLYYERALLELRRGDFDQALELIDQMILDREKNHREIELALARQMRARVLVERSDLTALLEIDAGEPLFRRLQCNYYLAISCYLRARSLSARTSERGRNAFSEFLRLAERFDYSYFARSEESFRPVLFDLCRTYSVSSAWLNLSLAPSEHSARSS